MINNKIYQWAVVGAGPGGITAVGMLLDNGVPPKEILWIDPNFQAGDFGRLWGEVNSNTRVALFLDYFNGVKHFDYAKKPMVSDLDKINPQWFTLLKAVTDPLLWVSNQLRHKVVSIIGQVIALAITQGCWQL